MSGMPGSRECKLDSKLTSCLNFAIMGGNREGPFGRTWRVWSSGLPAACHELTRGVGQFRVREKSR